MPPLCHRILDHRREDRNNFLVYMCIIVTRSVTSFSRFGTPFTFNNVTRTNLTESTMQLVLSQVKEIFYKKKLTSVPLIHQYFGTEIHNATLKNESLVGHGYVHLSSPLRSFQTAEKQYTQAYVQFKRLFQVK